MYIDQHFSVEKNGNYKNNSHFIMLNAVSLCRIPLSRCIIFRFPFI